MIKKLWADPAVRYALITFLVLRIFLALWAVVVLTLLPVPTELDDNVRPYFGEPPLTEGLSGALLGPWQRHDTIHYLRIARQDYDEVPDSVFPPIYPLGMRLIGTPFVSFLTPGESYLLGGLILSSLACIGLFILLYRVTAATFAAAEVDEKAARRAVLFLAIFPTSFFLLAGYSESLFILLALGSFWAGRRGRFWLAGILGFLAALTRLTGWILVVPLAYEYYRQFLAGEGRPFDLREAIGRLRGRNLITLAAVFLPVLGILTFFVMRELLGLPPLQPVYETYWRQTTGFPGRDLVTAVQRMFAGRAAFVHYLDFFCTFFLLGTTILAFRRLGAAYGLYGAALLFFMLLPASDQKPLFSFMRYTLAFFPTFMVLADAAKNPWINRLIFYPSVALLLYLSGQFFVWGWVA